jgi:hypothetical protein
MKKVILLAMLIGMLSSLSASMSYECWRYVGGSPQGYIKVSANSKSEAQSKAQDKFADLGKKVEYIKCK